MSSSPKSASIEESKDLGTDQPISNPHKVVKVPPRTQTSPPKPMKQTEIMKFFTFAAGSTFVAPKLTPSKGSPQSSPMKPFCSSAPPSKAKAQKKLSVPSSRSKQKPSAVPGLVQPKRPTSAYIFFVKDNLSRIKNEKEILAKEAMAQCWEAWKLMSEADRAPYIERGDADKKRFEKELEEFKAKGGVMTRRPQRKTLDVRKSTSEATIQSVQPALPVAPLKPELSNLQAFKPNALIIPQMFQQFLSKAVEESKVEPAPKMPKKPVIPFAQFVKERVPLTMKQYSLPSAATAVKKLSEVWREMTDSQKEPYKSKFEVDKKRYQAQLEELNTKGYFSELEQEPEQPAKAEPLNPSQRKLVGVKRSDKKMKAPTTQLALDPPVTKMSKKSESPTKKK